MPCWIQGSYRIRDFPKHVVSISAHSCGAPIAIERIDKGRLRCAPSHTPLTLEYLVYAFDSSVRSAWLDRTRGFFNGSTLFYVPEDRRDEECVLTLERPDRKSASGWKVATAMDPLEVDGDGFGSYYAPDYETLIDHPVELGNHERIEFEVDGIPHWIILAGQSQSIDKARLGRDVASICREARSLFDSQPAIGAGLDRYLFLCNVKSKGYGGLEHRASCALLCARDTLPRLGSSAAAHSRYQRFLGLVSHEYFHLWNVKRIRPQRLAGSDLVTEAYTRDLWLFEGVTSYYDNLLLLRAKQIDAPAYLDLLAEAATKVEREPGHKLQTLADASFESWIKYYQPDANSPNACTSYYAKGALVALCLDLTLRLHSEVTLDDVLRGLWRRYGLCNEAVPEGEAERLAEKISGLELGRFFDRALRSTEPLPLQELLIAFGVNATMRLRSSAEDAGGHLEKGANTASAEPLAVDIGIQLHGEDGLVAWVRSGSAAEAAGLAPGDIVVALDGVRVHARNFWRFLEGLTIGRTYRLHYFRDDQLYQTRIEATASWPDTWTLKLIQADVATLARRRNWIGV